MAMRKLSCFLIFFILFSNYCRSQSDHSFFNGKNLFAQFINHFSQLTCPEPLLCLQEIGLNGYSEVLLDSTYSDFYNRTRDDGTGLFSSNANPLDNVFHSVTIPYFQPYATFRVDCPDGYLVCLCHRFNSNTETADLLFLEFDSFDKDGILISRFFLPYLVNMSVGNDFLSVSTLLYASNSRLCFITSFFSNSHDYITEREIHYRINPKGQLVFDGEEKTQILKNELKRIQPDRNIILNY